MPDSQTTAPSFTDPSAPSGSASVSASGSGSAGGPYLTPAELAVLLDIVASASARVGDAYRLHDVLTRATQLASQPHRIVAAAPPAVSGDGKTHA